MQTLPYLIVIIVLVAWARRPPAGAKGLKFCPSAPNRSTALLLVDVTNSFFLEGMPNYYPEAAETLAPMRRLLEEARAAGNIVVHAVEQHYPGFDDYEWRKLPRHHFIGDADAAFFPGFEPQGAREILVRKRRFSAFFATDLALFLHEQKIERVVIAGVKTNVCIRARSQDAFANGFDVVVPSEATNSNRPHLAVASLEDIERYLVRVVALDERWDAGVKIVVTGYASLDYVVRLDAAPAPDETATVISRPRRMAAARRIAGLCRERARRGGRRRRPVTWIGDDETARSTSRAEALERRAKASARPGGRRSAPRLSNPTAAASAFTIPVSQRSTSPPRQRKLIAAADCLCITVGPPEATRAVLALARSDVRLVWAVKADPRAIPPDLAATLAARAEIVVHSRGEAPFVAPAFVRAATREKRNAAGDAGRRGRNFDAAGPAEFTRSIRSRPRIRPGPATLLSADFSPA